MHRHEQIHCFSGLMQRNLLSLRQPVGFFYLKDPAGEQFMGED